MLSWSKNDKIFNVDLTVEIEGLNCSRISFWVQILIITLEFQDRNFVSECTEMYVK